MLSDKKKRLSYRLNDTLYICNVPIQLSFKRCSTIKKIKTSTFWHFADNSEFCFGLCLLALNMRAMLCWAQCARLCCGMRYYIWNQALFLISSLTPDRGITAHGDETRHDPNSVQIQDSPQTQLSHSLSLLSSTEQSAQKSLGVEITV